MEHNINWHLNISILSSSSFFLENPVESAWNRHRYRHIFTIVGAVDDVTQDMEGLWGC